MTRQVMKYRNADATVTAILGPAGRKWTPMVYIDSPIRLSRVKNVDVPKFGTAIDYAARKAARTMLKAGKVLGIKKGAKRFLRSCL